MSEPQIREHSERRVKLALELMPAALAAHVAKPLTKPEGEKVSPALRVACLAFELADAFIYKATRDLERALAKARGEQPGSKGGGDGTGF